ncbi:retrovirus-related pol polyprotein from transposon TNT 1-94 [Tanacetum coccineum]
MASSSNTVSKPILIPDNGFLNNASSPSVVRKILNEVKDTIVTLQRVIKLKMSLNVNNCSSTVHEQVHNILKDEIAPIINQVDARVINFVKQFWKEATKFVGDFRYLAKEAEESMNKVLEYENKRLLRAIENGYAKLWNDCYKKCEECKYDKILYDKAYNDMQNQIVRLQAQLGDLKGQSLNTQCESETLDSLSQKHYDENVSLEFQVMFLQKENEHLKAIYQNLFDSIKDTVKGTSANTKFVKPSNLRKPPLQPFRNQSAVRQPTTSHSVPKTQELKVVKNSNVIAPRMFRINRLKNSREDNFMPNKQVKASVRTVPITTSQPHVNTKKDVNSNSNGLSSTGVDKRAKTRRLHPRSNTKNDRVPSTSKSSCIKNKKVEVEDHLRNLLLSKNQKHMSSEFNNIKLAIRNDKSEVVCDICKQCLITANHDVYVLNYVNDVNSYADNQNANVLNIANQKKHKAKVKKSKKLGSKERLASPRPRKPRTCLRWSPTGRIFDLSGKLIQSSDSECQPDISESDNACASNHQEPTSKWFPNSTLFLGRNILIARVYFVKGLGHNLLSIGQFCDSDLKFAFRSNTGFIINLEGVDLLKGNRSTNLYTINLHSMASASPICLMARATSTKSWLWYQRLSYLNFDTINELAKNNLITGLQKFKYSKEHLCPLCEQEKSKSAPLKPKPVPNSKQRLHLLHMDLCGPMTVESINGKRFDKTPYELINGRKPDISFLHVFGALCYPNNDREDIRKLGAKGDIGFYIGYSANSCAYRVYNLRTKKIMETMNITFDELSAMDFEQRSSKPELHAMYDDYIGGQLSVAPRTAHAAPATQNL